MIVLRLDIKVLLIGSFHLSKATHLRVPDLTQPQDGLDVEDESITQELPTAAYKLMELLEQCVMMWQIETAVMVIRKKKT